MRRTSLGRSSSKNEEIGTSMRAPIENQQQRLMETSSKVSKDRREKLMAEDQTAKGRTFDLESNGINLRLPSRLNRNDSAEKREDQSSTYSLESKYLFSRQQSTKKSKVSIEPSLVISNKNKRLAESFMQKLNLAQNHALTIKEASEEFIELIHELNHKECEYSDLTRPNKLMRSVEEEYILHQSPQNRRLRSQISEDLRRVRSFASKYKFPMYRKDIVGLSLDVGKQMSKVQSQKTHKKRTDPFKSDLSQLNLCRFETQPQSTHDKIFDPSDRTPMLFPSLKSRKRQALNDRQRHKLGVNYLKQRGKMKQKSKQKATNQRGKITLIKEIIHHWKVDNRFLNVRGDMEEEPLGSNPREYKLNKKN